MKKYVLTVVSFVLLITSFFFPSEVLNPAIYAGQGSGENATVENVTEVLDLFDYLKRYRDDRDEEVSRTNDTSATIQLLALRDDDDDDDRSSRRPKHTSVTMREETLIHNNSKKKTEVRDEYGSTYTSWSSSDLQFSRDLTVYMTEEASYYESKGSLLSNSTGDSYSSSTYFVFDVQIYSDDDVTLLRFNQMDYAQRSESDGEVETEEHFKNKSLIGQWIELPAGCEDDVMEMLDKANRDTLSTLGNEIENAMEENKLIRDGKTYKISIKDKDETVPTVKISIDLSDEQNPYIEMTQEVDFDIEQGSQDAYLSDVLTFSAIDNTVIKLKESAMDPIVFDSFEEFALAAEEG